MRKESNNHLSNRHDEDPEDDPISLPVGPDQGPAPPITPQDQEHPGVVVREPRSRRHSQPLSVDKLSYRKLVRRYKRQSHSEHFHKCTDFD